MNDSRYSIDSSQLKIDFLNRISIDDKKTENLENTKQETKEKQYSNEKIGMLLAILSTFCGSFGSFYTKLIQRAYPNEFHVVQFLFLRCFTLFF